MPRVYRTGNEKPYGTIRRYHHSVTSARLEGRVYPGHVVAAVVHGGVRERQPTAEDQSLGTLAINSSIHYWYHKCHFSGLTINSGALSVLLTQCTFGGDIGLRLADNPGGPVVVDGGIFQGNGSYAVFGVPPVALINCTVTGPGKTTFHGIRFTGGADFVVRDSVIHPTLALHSISVRDSGVNVPPWSITRRGTKHGVIARCNLHHVLHVGPQNSDSAGAGTFGGRFIDILDNDITSLGVQRWVVELIGGASHINVLDNRLLSWDDPPINNPPTHAHIQHRNQGNGLPKKVNAARNIYLGVGLENNL